MTDEELEMAVKKGMIHLHRARPGWWRTIDVNKIDFSDQATHILGLVFNCRLSETWQFQTWSINDLEQYGFVPELSYAGVAALTAEWRKQIDMKQRGKY